MIVSTRVGISVLAAALSLLTGCSSSGSGGSSVTRDQTAQTAPMAQVAQRYLVIAVPANKELDTSFDALDDHDDDLVASADLLRRIAATERQFDHDLLALRLPGTLGATASALVQVNEARANLTDDARSAASLDSLHRYEIELDALNAPVEDQVRLLRNELGLPPPDND